MTGNPTHATALLVIDLQEGMFDGRLFPPIHDAQQLEDRAKRVIAWARRTGHEVAFIRHDASAGMALAPGAPGWPIKATLGRRDDEPIFSKVVSDAFTDAELRRWIDNEGVRRVILLGAQTDQCVAATVDGALELGLTVVVVSDGHSTWASGGSTAAEIVSQYNERFAAVGASTITTKQLTDHSKA